MNWKQMILAGALIAPTGVTLAQAQEETTQQSESVDGIVVERNFENIEEFSHPEVSENPSRSERRVPLLSDIPTIGRLFDNPATQKVERMVDSMSAKNKPEPLILSGGGIEPDVYGEMIEDMSIMSRILDKALVEMVGKDRSEMVMGIVVSSLADKSLFQSVYLDGYGAMFTLNVDFPLAPTTEEPQAEVEEPVKNEAWEAAKQELFSNSSGVLRSDTDTAENYDAEKVERLRTGLLGTLKNASNMRHFEADDKIAVAVLSDRPKSTGASGETPAASRSVLMIQTTKTDVDAVANGDLTDEEFIEKTSVSIY